MGGGGGRNNICIGCIFFLSRLQQPVLAAVCFGNYQYYTTISMNTINSMVILPSTWYMYDASAAESFSFCGFVGLFAARKKSPANKVLQRG